MRILKVTTWNIAHMRRVFQPAPNPAEQERRKRRRKNIAKEILEIDPDILCIEEGPPSAADLEGFCTNDLDGAYRVVSSAADNGQKGDQWIWFLVKTWLAPRAELQDIGIWKSFAGNSWKVHYWGDFSEEDCSHFRHPQVLVLTWGATRVEFIGVHLKSKFVNRGEQEWNGTQEERRHFVTEALKARIKLATGAANVRAYIEHRFQQEPNPAIFVLGDANDGPGKEYFENLYLFFDLISTLQGDVFFAQRFLNHALFDFDSHLRWTVEFSDFVDPQRDPHILLDHILFTQGLVDGSLPLHVPEKAGLVEHQAHELVNANEPKYARTSDHRPTSVHVEAQEPQPMPAAMLAAAEPARMAAGVGLGAVFGCDTCVKRAVEKWSGLSGFPLNVRLKAIWAVHNGDTCNNDAMQRLARIIRDSCGENVLLDEAWCGRTVHDLQQQVCG